MKKFIIPLMVFSGLTLMAGAAEKKPEEGGIKTQLRGMNQYKQKTADQVNTPLTNTDATKEGEEKKEGSDTTATPQVEQRSTSWCTVQ